MQNVYERAKKKKDESCIFLSPPSLSLGMTNETFLEFADFFFSSFPRVAFSLTSALSPSLSSAPGSGSGGRTPVEEE